MDINDVSKINSLVRANFNKENLELNEGISKFVSMGNLVDMMDFSRVIFTKEIKTSFLTKQIFFDDEKFEMIALATIATFIQRGKNPVYGEEGIQVIKSGQARGGIEFDFSKVYFATNYDSEDKRILKKGDILINSTGVGTAGRVTLFDLNGKYAVDNHITILRTKNGVDNLYVFYTLAYGIGFKNIEAMAAGTSGQIELSVSTIQNIKIPLPPIDIQKKIVEECEKIDQKLQVSLDAIKQNQEKIHDIVNSMVGKKVKIASVCDLNTETINPAKEEGKVFIYIDIDSVENGTGRYSLDKKILGSIAPSRARRFATSGSTIISTVRPNLRGFAYIEKEIADSVYSTGFAILKSKDESLLANKMVYYQFMYSDNLMAQMLQDMPKGSYPSINKNNIDNFDILVSIDKQKSILVELDECEKKLNDARDFIANASSAKQAILDKYLK